MTDFFKRHTLIASTLLLTATGFATRLLGFFYRIFLSRTIGAEGLGIFNMVHPVYGICFALCAGSIQTAISRFVAANIRKGKQIFRTGLIISLTLSTGLAAFIIRFNAPLARYVLMEDRCASLLPFIAVSVPFSAVHACINGYYYGIKKTQIPAASQIAEQTVRMAAVFLIADILTESGRSVTVELAATGHLIGELAACLFSVLCFCLFSPASSRKQPAFFASLKQTAVPLMALALPLMGNRLVLNILSAAEAVWIPSRLTDYGLSSQEAIRVYGVLTGMSMPFILFPSAITNSMAVLLLPAVAEAQADGNESRIAQTISMSLRYSLYMGILCIGVFTLFGAELGLGVFHDSSAGSFMQILAWLCPFLYLATTMGSILNGLGKTTTTFLQNITALVLRLAFVLIGIPRFGIMAYLWGMLASELLLAILHLTSLKRLVSFSWDAIEMIAKPAAFLIISIGIYYAVFSFWDGFDGLGLFVSAALHIGVLCLCYGGLLAVFHIARQISEKS